jgi:hypothetical protein
MLRSRMWVWEWWTRESLERGVVLPEGVHSPRARWSFARGGVQPSREMESCPRGRIALERGGFSPEGAPSPRARLSFGGTALYPSSEVESRSRCAGTDRSVGR